MPIELENVQITSYQLGAVGAPVIGQMFLTDPIGTMRRQGLAVAPAAEPAWRQLALALQTLQRASDGSARTGAQTPYLEIRIPVR